MKYVFLLVITVGFAACGGTDKKEDPKAADKTVMPHSSKHSAAFNQSFDQLLGAYYALKDALVDYDTATANAAAKALQNNAAMLPGNAGKDDAEGVLSQQAKALLDTIRAGAAGFLSEKDLQKKKIEFSAISGALYKLLGNVAFDDQKVYQQHCPMAFNDQDEAFWLSNSSKIVNPYLGRKHPKYKAAMAGCGSVTDSLGN